MPARDEAASAQLENVSVGPDCPWIAGFMRCRVEPIVTAIGQGANFFQVTEWVT
jgi:hypothetical protein